jgi:hypothetical protein
MFGFRTNTAPERESEPVPEARNVIIVEFDSPDRSIVVGAHILDCFERAGAVEEPHIPAHHHHDFSSTRW